MPPQAQTGVQGEGPGGEAQGLAWAPAENWLSPLVLRDWVLPPLRLNKRSGRVVSAKMSHNAMARYPHSKLMRWNVATKQARERLGFHGFVKMGKGDQGRQLLEVTRSIYNNLGEDCENISLW